MQQKGLSHSLLESLVARTRLQWYPASGIIIGLLLVLLVLAAYLDGPLAQLWDWTRLRGPLLPLTVLAYILAIIPPMGRLRDQAIAAFNKMLDAAPGSPGPVAAAMFQTRRRWEIVSLSAGIVVWLVLSQPWRWVDRPLAVYAAGIDMLMFAVLGLIVFEGLTSSLRISRVTRLFKLDSLDTRSLAPVANWSLGISLAFVGGISISILFQDLQNLRQVTIVMFYAGLVLVALITFFLSVLGTRSAISKAKRVHLDMVRGRLDLLFSELRQLAGPEKGERIAALNAEIAAWLAYENRVERISEWPFNTVVLGRLTASVLLPSLVYLGKILIGIGL